MFEHDYAAPHGSPLSGDAGNGSATLAQSCTDLLDALLEFTVRRDLLEAEQLSSAPDADVASLLNAVWVIRRDCAERAAVVRISWPRTTHEQAIKRNVLAAYASLTDMDELPRRPLTEFSPLRDFPSHTVVAPLPNRVSPLMSWLTDRLSGLPDLPGSGRLRHKRHGSGL